MNSTPQLVPHLDAELIGAFVENALPAPEREEVMSHLATCAHCRQIVYLAQDAAQENVLNAEQPHVAVKQIPRRRSSWITNWRFVWLPAAACAALGALVVSFTLVTRTPQPPAQVAANHQPPSAPTDADASVSPATPSPKASPALQRPDSVATPSRARTDESLQLDANQTATPSSNANQLAIQNSNQLNSNQAAAPIANSAQLNQSRSVSGGAIGIGVGQQSQNVAVEPAPQANNQIVSVNASAATVDVTQSNPLDQQKLQQQLQQQAAVNSAIQNQPNEVMPLQARNLEDLGKASKNKKEKPTTATANSSIAQAGPASPTASAAPAAGSTTVQVSGAAAQVVDESALPRAATGAAFGGPIAQSPDEIAARSVLYTRMPSGLAAISTAALPHRILAVDSAGALFLSNDLGKTWLPVASQWTGRAVQVLVHHSANKAADSQPTAGYSGQEIKDKSALNSPAANVPVFELVTDDISTWSSPDGKTWKRGLP